MISKFLLNKCVITLLTDRKSAAHIYTHYAQMHTRRLKIMNMNAQTNQYINKQAKVINICKLGNVNFASGNWILAFFRFYKKNLSVPNMEHCKKKNQIWDRCSA